MTATLELLDPRTHLWSVTTDQYHQMIRDGVLEEGQPYELLDGHIVRKDRSAKGEDSMTIGTDHAWLIIKLNRLGRQLESFGCHMRVQLPITLEPRHEPEPDGVIARGAEDAYRAAHPTAGDVLAVIEVADASLRRDRTTKYRIYADAGIAHYILINLTEKAVEVYTEPQIGRGRYGRSITLANDQAVDFPTAAGSPIRVRVSELFA